MSRLPIFDLPWARFLSGSPRGVWYRWTLAGIIVWGAIGVVYSEYGGRVLGRVLFFGVIYLAVGAILYRPEMFAGPVGLFLMPWFVGGVAAYYAPEFVKLEFYKAVAQALPVLLLTFVIEKRQEFRPIQGRLLSPRFTQWSMILFLIAASFLTFQALAYENAHLPYASKLVIGALAGTVTLLVLPLFAARNQP